MIGEISNAEKPAFLRGHRSGGCLASRELTCAAWCRSNTHRWGGLERILNLRGDLKCRSMESKIHTP